MITCNCVKSTKPAWQGENSAYVFPYFSIQDMAEKKVELLCHGLSDV